MYKYCTRLNINQKFSIKRHLKEYCNVGQGLLLYFDRNRNSERIMGTDEKLRQFLIKAATGCRAVR